MKKTVSRVLVLLLVAAMLLIQVPVFAAPQADEVSIQDGVTLHCWNWSFKNIEAKLDIIKSLGYTTIQTSPIQEAKQPTLYFPTNDWWVYYQPAAFRIDNTGNSALGTKEDFESMCKAAHDRGIKVIVDVVANHMANSEDGTNGIAASVSKELSGDATNWHDINKNTNNYTSRLEVTQYCMAGLPDLNTANKNVQNYVLDYLKECIDAGADGFRFDAVKHIEVPEDGDLGSDFWPTVIDGAKDYAKQSRDLDLYCYGELLDAVGGNLGPEVYTKYMSVTDNGWSANLLGSVVNGGNASAYSVGFGKGKADLMVAWPESHDTYADGSTMDVSESNINKAWALIAARKDVMGLYLARPANFSQLLGAASNTAWSYPEVAAVNQFHNAFAGQSEYVSNENGIVAIERGDAGVVLVNCNGAAGDVTVTASKIKDGTYTDQITGNSFTVADGKISGSIGETGIAVVYDVDACDHEEHDQEGFCLICCAQVGHSYDENNDCACGSRKVAMRTVYFVNTGNWSTVNFYSWYDAVAIFTDAWPGNAMTKVSDNLYSCSIPEDIPNIIFNDGGSIQTSDLTVPALSKGQDQFNFTTQKWETHGEEAEEPTEPVVTPTEPTGSDDNTTDGGFNVAFLIPIIAAVVVAAALVVVMIMKKKQ